MVLVVVVPINKRKFRVFFVIYIYLSSVDKIYSSVDRCCDEEDGNIKLKK